MVVQRRPFTFVEKAGVIGACALAGAIFLTIGWMAMEPDDPRGAVSVLARRHGLAMLGQVAALSAVTSMLATLAAGRRLADIGVVAVAIGLAVVALRGSTARYLLIEAADGSAGFATALGFKLALESTAWFAVIAVAAVASAAVTRWCYGPCEVLLESEGSKTIVAGFPLLAEDVPRLTPIWLGVRAGEQTPPVDGVKHMLLTAGGTLFLISVLSAGLASRAIEHGQACFVVGASVAVASYVAFRLYPVRSGLWALTAIWLVAVLAYLWAGLRGVSPTAPAALPNCHYLRILPIQYISVGSIAAIVTYWISHLREVEIEAARQRTHGQNRRP